MQGTQGVGRADAENAGFGVSKRKNGLCGERGERREADAQGTHAVAWASAVGPFVHDGPELKCCRLPMMLQISRIAPST